MLDQLKSSSVGPAPSARSSSPELPLRTAADWPLACRVTGADRPTPPDDDAGLAACSAELVLTGEGGLAAHGGTHDCFGSGLACERRLEMLVLRFGRAWVGEVLLEAESLRATLGRES